MSVNFPKLAQLKSSAELAQRLLELNCRLPMDDRVLLGGESPLAENWRFGERNVGNRWCIHPMEGWDAEPDGSPSELTFRRWRRFGESGAKLIWGGEAAAVRPDGRANPRQTMAVPSNSQGLAHLIGSLRQAHRSAVGSLDDLIIGLQLTHSGRFCRPHDQRLEPRIAYHHPLLDVKIGIAPDDDSVVWTDQQLDELVEDYVQAARLAWDVGFDFVDIKACHGYLLHEFLSAEVRPGRYGGDFHGRTRLLRTIVGRVRDELPGLMIGVRLSVFDGPPFEKGDPCGRPMDFRQFQPYRYAFGANRANPLEIDLAEPIELIRLLQRDGVVAVNLTCGSPYYNPHWQRPAIFPPSDGYAPPEDPLVGVTRQIQAVRQCKLAVPTMPMVGTGYTYLQEFLPHVAQAVVRQKWVDAVGLGRMVLSYPTMPADLLAGRAWQRKFVCRTFSDCTTGPRNGLVSGCYPLDAYYKQLPEAEVIRRLKGGRSTADEHDDN